MSIAIINCFPGLTPEMFLDFTHGKEAIILQTYATGQIPRNLTKVIKQCVDNGVPVFGVSDNPGAGHGIVDDQFLYDDEKKCGIIRIEKANVEDMQVIAKAIEEALQSGLRGNELGEAVRKRFAYDENELKPRPEWEENPRAATDMSLRRRKNL